MIIDRVDLLRKYLISPNKKNNKCFIRVFFFFAKTFPNATIGAYNFYASEIPSIYLYIYRNDDDRYRGIFSSSSSSYILDKGSRGPPVNDNNRPAGEGGRTINLRGEMCLYTVYVLFKKKKKNVCAARVTPAA